MIRKIILIVASLCLGGVLVFTASAAPAQAKTRFVEGIGLITGYYSGGDYSGIKQPVRDGQCVQVQRKSSGTWKTTGIYHYQDCTASNGSSYWAITDNAAATSTTGIRLVNIATGRGFNLCSTVTECRAM